MAKIDCNPFLVGHHSRKYYRSIKPIDSFLFILRQTVVEQNFKEKFNKLFEHLATEQQVTDDNIRSLMFGDYMASKDEQKSYDEVQDLDTLREVMETIDCKYTQYFIHQLCPNLHKNYFFDNNRYICVS